MVFYASLFLVCVVISCVVVWFYRSFEEAGKAAYRALLPSSRDNQAKQTRVVEHVKLGSTPSPWGWQNSSGHGRATLSKTTPATASGSTSDNVPWGWPGSDQKPEKPTLADSAQNFTQAVNRAVDRVTSRGEDLRQTRTAQKEDEFRFAGKKYKVIRKKKFSSKNANASKPWGW